MRKKTGIAPNIKNGSRVLDRWWPHWGTASIKRLSANRWSVNFIDGARVYDRAHLQFLDRVA